MKAISIHLKAKNTPSGNPARCFVLLDTKTGNIIDIVDEGYRGSGALDLAAIPRKDIIEGPSFDITNANYRELIRARED